MKLLEVGPFYQSLRRLVTRAGAASLLTVHPPNEDACERSADLLGALAAGAPVNGATVGQVALAWCLHARGRDRAPPLALVGARTPDMVRDALGALRVDLSPSDVEGLAATAARCPQAQVNAFQTK